VSALLAFLVWSSTECASCHPAQAAAFEASRHAVAGELAIFTVSEGNAKTAWCATCHRPAPRGLDCTSCHAAGDAIRTWRPPTRAARSAHAIVVDAAPPCARCHEFNTPLPDHLDPVVYSDQPLQRTVTEAGGARCVDCHDPHTPRGSHDAAMLRRAVAISARATRDATIIRIAAQRVGHRFPTGDPFRRVVIAVYGDGPAPLATATIGKQLALVAGVWAPVRDRTLADGEVREIRLPRATRWTAVYAYGDPRFERALPASEVSIELAGGPLQEVSP